jgi:hypothetical protein
MARIHATSQRFSIVTSKLVDKYTVTNTLIGAIDDRADTCSEPLSLVGVASSGLA